MIEKLREEYLNGKKTRYEIGKDLFEAEKSLFNFCFALENNPCKSIEIREDGVTANFLIDGYSLSMYLDELDAVAVPNQIIWKGSYEEEELITVKRLMSFLPKDARVFDVGANLGWYGLNLKKENNERKIYFFEPVPETYARLKKNIELNKLEDCVAENVGLYYKKEKKKFYYDVVESGASSLTILREQDKIKVFDAELIKLDDYIEENNIVGCDFIKCDVEGAEFFVYQGAKETIKKYKPIVFSEMLRKWSAKFNYHPNDIISFFKELGYKCYVIAGNKLKECQIVTEETVETNYFFLNEDAHKIIIDTICI